MSALPPARVRPSGFCLAGLAFMGYLGFGWYMTRQDLQQHRRMVIEAKEQLRMLENRRMCGSCNTKYADWLETQLYP